MLGRAVSSFLESLKEVAEGGFEVEVKGGEISSCFSDDSVLLLRHS